MKILHLSATDARLGASRAAYRIHQSLARFGTSSTMLVGQSATSDPSVYSFTTRSAKLYSKVIALLDLLISQQLETSNPYHHSISLLPTFSLKALKYSDYNVYHLHWINRAFLSLYEIEKIKKPIVWTLHDSWPFCASEHHPMPTDNRFINGYPRKQIFDLNWYVWKRKLLLYENLNIHFVAPSEWMASQARKSFLLKDKPITVIPNPLDISVYRPLPAQLCKELFKLPSNKTLILHSGVGKTKGFDLFCKMLEYCCDLIPECELVILGAGVKKQDMLHGFKAHYIEHIYDDITLAVLYSAADLMVVTSPIESFCQTASEAQSCGLPVISFDSSGLKDIVINGRTGYLAEAYSINNLAKSVRKLVLDYDIRQSFSSSARSEAANRFNYDCIAKRYLKVYEEVSKNSS